MHLFATLILCVFIFASQASAQCAAVTACLKGTKPCDNLPVPERSVAAPLPEDIELRQLRPGVWLYRDFAYMSLIVRSFRKLVLIDAPDSDTGSNKEDGSRTRLTDAMLTIMNGTEPTSVDLVYTHAHMDHIGASRRVVEWTKKTFPNATMDIYGTKDARMLVNRSVTKRAIWPNMLLERGVMKVITLTKDLKITMKIVGGHSGQDVQVYIPPNSMGHGGILMIVDIVFPRWAPYSELGLTEDVPRYIEVHNDILKMDFQFYIGGHVRVGDKDDVAESLRFMEDLVTAAKNSGAGVTQEMLDDIGFNDFFTPGTPQYRNVWFAAVNAGNNLGAQVCAREIIRKWGCVLGGVAETAFLNCNTVINYLNIDT